MAGDSNFRATFSADTTSFASQMRQMKEDSHQMATEMIEDALSVAKATDQNVNKVLQEQIALYERRRELLKSEERMELDSRFGAKMRSASPENRSGIQSQWEKAKADLTDQFKRDDMQIDLLREVISTLKETAQQQMVEQADVAADNIRAVREGRTESMRPDDEYKARVQASLAPKEKVEKTPREKEENSMWETAKGTFLGQMAVAAVHKLAGVANSTVSSTDGEIAATKLWSVIPVVGDALATASARHVELAEQRDRAAFYIKARGANVDLLSDEESDVGYEKNEEIMKARARGDIKDNVLVDNYAEKQAEETSRMLRAQKETAKREEEIAVEEKKERAASSWKYLEAGVDGIDFLNRAGRLLPALGTANGLAGQTKSLIDITQGGGIDEGTALGMANIIRQNGGGSLRDTMGSVVGELSSGGTTRANRDRNVGEVVSMAQGRFGEGFATADPVKLAKVKAAFQNNFGNTLGSGDNIQNIMNTMAKPSDEYQQAMNYKIYSDQMARDGKEASYVGFQKWQEKPEEGLLGGKMDYLSSIYGSGQYGVMAMHGAGVGRTWEANELYLKGGTKGLSAEEIASKSRNMTSFNATNYTTQRQQDQAKLTDAYTKGMLSGLKEAFSQLEQAIAQQSSVAAALLSFLKSEKKN